MLKIKKTSKFIANYIHCGIKYRENIVELDRVVLILASGHKLHSKYKDHALHGEWTDFRECHIVEVSDDWLLIYKIVGKLLLLVDTGSHKELFDKN